MAVYKDAASLAKAQQRRFANVRRSVTIETESLVEDMRAEAIRLTSGTVSTKTLAYLGYPFSRAKGSRATVRLHGRKRVARISRHAYVPLLPINMQTRELQKSLRVFKTSKGWRLSFTSAHAKYVLAPGGTKTMVARGFYTALRRALNNKRATQLKRLIQAARTP